MAITKKVREEIECMLIEFFDKLDKSKTNSEYLQEKWAKMSDAQFESWLKKKYPLQLQVRAWEVEPVMKDFFDAASVLGVSLTEKVAEPFLYINKEGIPVNTYPALKMRLNIKKVQQVITKKNKVSVSIDLRDKTGRLMTADKGAATSDKEQESLAVMGLYNTMSEFSTIKADAMQAKSEAYNQILNTGTLSNQDYKITKQDSVARNIISAYMIASHIDSNLVNSEGYTPYTMKEKSRRTQRI